MRQVLNVPNFRLLWIAHVISNFGDSLTNLGLLILVNELTGSATALAIMGIALGLPKVIFGMLAGVYVDRLDRKKLMVYSDVVRAIFVLGFILVTSRENLWILYIIGFIQSSIGTLFNPARNAIIPNLLPEKDLMAANALIQTSAVVIGVLGAAAAGITIGVFETYIPIFTLDSLTFLVSALLVARIQVASTHIATDHGSADVILRQLREGVVVLFRVRLLLGTLIAIAVAMLGLGAVNILLVPLLVNDLKVPETWFGLVQLMQVSAMVISSVFVGYLAARYQPTRIISVSLVALGLLTALFSGVGAIWQLFIVLFFIGAVVTPLQASTGTIMQTAVGDEMRGRAGAALDTLVQSANLLSMAFAGLFADWIGLRTTLAVGGVLVVIAGCASSWIFGDRLANSSLPVAPEANPGSV